MRIVQFQAANGVNSETPSAGRRNNSKPSLPEAARFLKPLKSPAKLSRTDKPVKSRGLNGAFPGAMNSDTTQ